MTLLDRPLEPFRSKTRSIGEVLPEQARVIAMLSREIPGRDWWGSPPGIVWGTHLTFQAVQIRPVVRDNNRKLIVGWILPDGVRAADDEAIVKALRENLPEGGGDRG